MSTLAVRASDGSTTGAGSALGQVDAATTQKIQKNAQEFEGILVRQMLRELRESPFAPQGDIMSKSYQESADDQLAKHIVQAGGLGFGKAMADLMLRQIQQSSLIGSSASTVKPSTTGAP
jgi:Rod binding domain-containing protein